MAKKTNKNKKTNNNISKKPIILEQKETKKQPKNQKLMNNKTSDNNQVVLLIKIIILVTVIFVIMYFITTLITNNTSSSNTSSKEKTTNSTEGQIQYDEILIGTMLKQNNSEYYVLLKQGNDDNVTTYENSISAYSSGSNAVRVYTIDLSKSFNKQFVSNKSNLLVDNIDDFKVKETTFLKIQNSKVTASYEGYDEITNQLSTMAE